jgi:class 3 adenylate cyclase
MAAAGADRLPSAQLRAVYATKAAGVASLLILLWLLRWSVYPALPAGGHSTLIALILLPTCAVAWSRGEVAPGTVALSLAADVLALTAGIHFNGGVDNTGGPVLYMAIIALAGLVASARAALLTAAGSAASYGLLCLAEGLGWLPHRLAYTKSTDDAIATVAVVSVYFFLGAWLVSYATRQVWALHRHVEELRAETLGARALTVVFGELVGLAELTNRVGDARAHRAIQDHKGIVRTEVAAHEGVGVELRDDGFLLAFGDPAQAGRCAVNVQRAFAAYSAAHPQVPIRARIGLHTGEAIQAGERLFGKTVILASRIAAQAQGGEILASARLKELAEHVADLRFAAGREVQLKGLADRYTLHPVAWAPA